MTLVKILLALGLSTASATPSSSRQITAQTIKNGSGVITLPTTTVTLCGITESCTLTNKTLTSPAINGSNFNFGTASNSNRLLLPSETTANLSGLTQTAGLIAYDTTQGKPVYNNGTAWTAVGAGSGSTNFITTGDAEASTTGWSTYADAAGATPVDCTGGSPSSTWTASSSSPLTGNSSYLWTKSAANRQGEGVSYAFTIDAASKAKVMSIEFDSLVSSGTFVAGSPTVDSDQEIYIYDVTNATVIQPSTYKIYSNSTLTAARTVANFQTASNSTSYRLCIHTATTSASAYTMQYDSFVVAPSKYTYGTPITDWVTFTPTGSWSANTTYTGYWRRVGDSAEVLYNVTTTGAPTSTNLTLNAPTGVTPDTTFGPLNVVGPTPCGGVFDTSANTYWSAVCFVGNGPFEVRYHTVNAASASGSEPITNTQQVTQALPMTFASGDKILIRVSYKVAGWSSSVQMSDSADQRVVAFAVNTTPTGTPQSSDTIVNWGAAAVDTHGAWNGTTTYTVPVSGYYEMSSTIYVTGTSATSKGAQISLRKNGSAVAITSPITDAASTRNGAFATTVVSCVAGDTLSVYFSTQFASPVFQSGVGTFTIKKVQGPSAVGATETIAARYYASSTSISSSLATIVWTTKDQDTHGAMSSGVFTVPAAGRYQVNSCVALGGTYALNNNVTFQIQKNSAAYSTLTFYAAAAITAHDPCVSDVVTAVAGDTIRVQASSQATSPSIVPSNDRNYISIIRVGI